jgi:hypothetical protein
MLVDLGRLEREYFEHRPDVLDPNQMVILGTSGHRGSPLSGTFTEEHIMAITQAICDYRAAHGTDGPLYMGKDTHAISGPAQRTALEVLAANGIETLNNQRAFRSASRSMRCLQQTTTGWPALTCIRRCWQLWSHAPDRTRPNTSSGSSALAGGN